MHYFALRVNVMPVTNCFVRQQIKKGVPLKMKSAKIMATGGAV